VIRHRKFYATRHTFITEAIKRGENPLAVAQYCGTSLAMIQADYCGTLDLVARTKLETDRTKIAQPAEKPLENVASPTGFEPMDDLARMRDQVRQIRVLNGLRALKSA
jgi:hypothetical protein